MQGRRCGASSCTCRSRPWPRSPFPSRCSRRLGRPATPRGARRGICRAAVKDPSTDSSSRRLKSMSPSSSSSSSSLWAWTSPCFQVLWLQIEQQACIRKRRLDLRGKFGLFITSSSFMWRRRGWTAGLNHLFAVFGRACGSGWASTGGICDAGGAGRHGRAHLFAGFGRARRPGWASAGNTCSACGAKRHN